ncbi:hypothetical protein PC117_g27546, partial [Phytophthora cactorum]
IVLVGKLRSKSHWTQAA